MSTRERLKASIIKEIFYPWHGAYCGDIDLTGWRKPISHYREMLYNCDEGGSLYMAVRKPSPEEGEIKLTLWSVWPTWESWTWPGHEGKFIEVEVYSKSSKVRLYLNDRIVGEKATTRTEEYRAIFSIPYEPGELRAVAMDESGHELESTILNTVGEAVKLKLTADRSELSADGQDLSYVTVEVLDAKGRLQCNADDLIEFSIEGPGSIIGVDNGNLNNEEAYVATARHAWHGRAMVVVRSERHGKGEGEIKLTASSNDLSQTTITLLSKPYF